MKLILPIFLITITAFAQNIDRTRLHQELEEIAVTKPQNAPPVPSVGETEQPNNKTMNKNVKFADDDLEQSYFNDKVRNKKAAPKRQK